MSTSQRFLSLSHTGPFEKSRFLRSAGSMVRLRLDRTARHEPVKGAALEPHNTVAVFDELDLAVRDPVPQRPGADAEIFGGLYNVQELIAGHRVLLGGPTESNTSAIEMC